jgi:hypothetical protein
VNIRPRRPLLALVSLVSWLIAALVVLTAPRTAWAIEYEIFIDVDTYDELNELWVNGIISEDTFNTLVELQRRGVDLNQGKREDLYSLPNLNYDDVDRIIAYRTEAGVIHTPADLVAAGVLSREKLGSILMFIQGYDGRRKAAATHGWFNYQTGWSQADSTVPPMSLQARITTLRQLTVGFAGLVTRQRPGAPIWDPNREALLAEQMQARVNVPKLYAQWDTEKWGVIAGSYRIGFGQRLTFDNTSRYTPNGFIVDDAVFRYNDLGVACRESQGELPESPCAGEAGRVYTTKDFRWRDSLRGVAIGAKHLDVGVGWLQLYGWGSYQTKQLYQYEIYDRRACDDPRSSNPACSAPDVYVARDGQPLLEPTSTHKFQTLPNLYDEVVGGANFTWFHDRRTHVGVTGYGATALWKVEGAELDFQEWSSTPFGGSWGAIGADMSWGYRWSDLSVEVARSFDSMQRSIDKGEDGSATSILDDEPYGGGGMAGIVRHTSTFGSNEIEVSARYYDKQYANPYARPIAQADQFDGNRARDEAGGRIRYGGRLFDRLDLRALADVWIQPTERSPKLLAYVRGDIDVNKWFRPGLWLQYRNVDLRPDSKAGCYSTADADENDPNPDGTISYRFGCLAEVGQVTARLSFRPLKNKLSITAQYQHEVIDDVIITDRLRQDSAAFLIIRANPISSFRIVARIRYLFEDIADNARYEQSAWAYFDMSYVFAKRFLVRTRYDAFVWLDQRTSTLSRIPSPEHRLRLELELRF